MRIGYFIAACVMLVLVSCGLPHNEYEHNAVADSIFTGIRKLCYRDHEMMRHAAQELTKLDGTDDEDRAAALNAIAYSEFISMNYGAARELYASVIKDSGCEVERLVADVGMMLICYRTSANREFFDYRSDALQRVRRISEEEAMLPDDERLRFYSARLELAAVSLCYFANLGMVDEAERAALYIEGNIASVKELPRMLYGRMLLNYRTELPVANRIESLTKVLARAEAEGELWLTANSRLMLAVLLRSGEAVGLLQPAQMALINGDNMPDDELALYLAQRAADEFRVYGDKYMLIEALSVAASCCTQSGRFGEALALLEEAMLLINDYYKNSYPELAVELTLETAGDDAEYALLTNDSVANIYECLLSVRRDASCAYSGVGDKYLSDINRNSYLDLLRTTRLNKQIESRINAAESSAARLYLWLVLLVVLLAVVSLVVYRSNIRWRRRKNEHLEALTTLLSLCRRLMASLPKEIADFEEVNEAVASILNSEVVSFAGGCRFVISSREIVPQGANVCCMHPATIDEPLVNLYIITERQLTPQDMSFLHIALPYIAAAIDEGRRVADIGGERQRLQEQSRSYSLYLDEHKRENVNKRVSLSVVAGMRPYMDRMLNELGKLSEALSCGDVERMRIEYLLELTSVIDEYNVVLARWIKMRRGELSLHIESFALSELLGIISKSVAAFELKGIVLEVKDSPLVVKADKALTLFMINTLADNAGKFTPRGGKVTVEAVDGGSFIEIAVTDTGVGMSAEDVERILSSKVYDASQIACSGGMSANKGSGFGLMNCKGIIEKYRKTDELFSVCCMDIKSSPGHGSRFSFRLPKGVMRVMMLVLVSLFTPALSASEQVFEILADSVYSCNVKGDYVGALNAAKELVAEMNVLYRNSVAEGTDTLSLSSGESTEILWWRKGLFTDSLTETVYYNLLDMRNEVAVAALALQDWPTYRYNNAIYTRLYRLVHEDKELVNYYEYMQSVANYRRAAVVLCVTVLLLLMIVALVKYMRNVVTEKMNRDILLQANAKVLEVARGMHRNETQAQVMAHELYTVLHDYLRVVRVALLLRNGEESQRGAFPLGDEIYSQQKHTIGFPLKLFSSDVHVELGELTVVAERRLNENEKALLELVADYLASAVYHSFVRLVHEYNDLDEIEEAANKLKFEENTLHVRNMVIDNCLSVIKHETIYYPGRIRELLLQLRKETLTFDEWHSKVSSMGELMDYYNSIYSVLASCAARQMDDANFKVAPIMLSEIFSHMRGYVKRISARKGGDIMFDARPTDAVASGDTLLLEYLFESLISSLVSLGAKGLELSVADGGDVLNIEILGRGVILGNKRCAAFFVPTQDESVTMEPLIAREIMRMHEDFMDRRASRLVAEDVKEGCVIRFTLPKIQKNR